MARRRRSPKPLRDGADSGLRVVDDALSAKLCGSALTSLVGYAKQGHHAQAVLDRAARGVVACFAARPCKPLAGRLAGLPKGRRPRDY